VRLQLQLPGEEQAEDAEARDHARDERAERVDDVAELLRSLCMGVE
jgi:hypothetical protein